MGDEAAWSGDDYISAHAETLQLLIVAVAVVATINSHAAHILQVVAEALHGLVYLLGQLAGWRHDDAVDGVFRIAAIIKLAQYWEQIGCCLAGSGLCHAQYVVTFQYLRDTFFLYRGAGVEAHVV